MGPLRFVGNRRHDPISFRNEFKRPEQRELLHLTRNQRQHRSPNRGRQRRPYFRDLLQFGIKGKDWGKRDSISSEVIEASRPASLSHRFAKAANG